AAEYPVRTALPGAHAARQEAPRPVPRPDGTSVIGRAAAIRHWQELLKLADSMSKTGPRSPHDRTRDPFRHEGGTLGDRGERSPGRKGPGRSPSTRCRWSTGGRGDAMVDRLEAALRRYERIRPTSGESSSATKAQELSGWLDRDVCPVVQ